MSAPAVKPALPTSGAQAPKVGSGAPTSTTVNSPPTSTAGGPKIPPNTAGIPVKPTGPVNANHAVASNIPLSLDHKAPVNILSQPQLPVPRTPEKIKEHPLIPPGGIKPTSNGVEGSPNKLPVVALPPTEIKKLDEGAPSTAVLNHAAEIAIVAATPLQQSSAPTPVTQTATPLTGITQQSPAKQEVTPKAATTNHTAPLNSSNKPDGPSPGLEIKSLAAAEPIASTPAIIAPPTPVVVSAPAPTAALVQTHLPESPSKLTVVQTDVTKTRIEIVKPEFKVATPPRNSKRKRDIKLIPEVKTPISDQHDDRKSKRVRTRTQPYQSPLPELTYIAKLKTLMKSPDDKLIVFYKNEFLAVRNAEGSFYVCQAMQNIYKSSARIRIRWLSQEKKDNKPTDVYIPDFYDATDFDCILTNLELKKLDKNKFQLPQEERDRTQSILKRALDVEKGVAEKPSITEEHPDGLDLSLYRNESQLKKRRGSKRSSRKGVQIGSESEASQESGEEESEDSEDDTKKNKLKQKSKPNKVVEKPKIAVKEKVKTREKEIAKRAERASERERGRERGAIAKRRSEPLTSVKNTVAKPPLEKKAKVVPTKPTRKSDPVVENPLPTRSAKTRTGVKAATPQPKSSPVTRTKDRERRGVNLAKGRKKPGKKA